MEEVLVMIGRDSGLYDPSLYIYYICIFFITCTYTQRGESERAKLFPLSVAAPSRPCHCPKRRSREVEVLPKPVQETAFVLIALFRGIRQSQACSDDFVGTSVLLDGSAD